ncbi:hypothetical protein [Rufibacter soli]
MDNQPPIPPTKPIPPQGRIIKEYDPRPLLYFCFGGPVVVIAVIAIFHLLTNNNVMKADEAVMLAQEATKKANLIHEKNLESLFPIIKEAAEKGSLTVTIDERIDDFIVKRLKGLGYTVTFGSQYNEGYTVISWGNVPIPRGPLRN